MTEDKKQTIETQQNNDQIDQINTMEADSKNTENENTENIDEMPEIDENMMAQVQEMMQKLEKAEKAEEFERENIELKNKLGRLAADFEGYRNRTSNESKEAENKGIAKAAEALMPIYDDISRALNAGVKDPSTLISGFENVKNKILDIFKSIGLEATGQINETFNPNFHEAIQVVEGENDIIIESYELGFKMENRCIRAAKVAVGKNNS